MAQLTSVRLRVRADNSIDRRCSTDTAYPFQLYQGQPDLYTGMRGWFSSGMVTVEGRERGGETKGDCGAPATAVVALAALRP